MGVRVFGWFRNLLFRDLKLRVWSFRVWSVGLVWSLSLGSKFKGRGCAGVYGFTAWHDGHAWWDLD